MENVDLGGGDNNATLAQLGDFIRKTVTEVLAEQDKAHPRFVAPAVLRGAPEFEYEGEIPEREKGMAAARMVRALAAGRNNPDAALHFMRQAKFDDRPGDRVEKALAAGQFDAGGFMLPDDMVQEILDLLRPRSVVRNAGVPTVPMPLGTLTMPKQTSDSTANYVGENKSIPVSEPDGGQIVMSSKKLATLVPVSNDLLLLQVGSSADAFIRNSIVRKMATREDQAFLRDDGTANTPKGMRNWANAANISAISGATAADIEADLKDMMNDLEGKNVDMNSATWFMNPRTKNHLLVLREGAGGNLIYPEMRLPTPTLHGFPFAVSNNIPANLGGGTDTEILLANVQDLLIGEVGTMQIVIDFSASYSDGANTISAFQNDQTLVRAITRHDFAAMYTEAISVRTGVSY